MVADPRIKSYCQVAQAMKAGNFSVRIPVITEGEDDEVGQLGVELSELGNVLERRRREMRELLKVTERINAGLILEEILNYVFDNFRPIIPYDRIGFSLLDDSGETVHAIWARSDTSEIAISAGYSAPLRGSSLEKIIETGQPRILNDLVEYLKDHPDSESTRKIVSEGIRSSLTCPLITQSKPVGFMFFSSRQPNTYRSVHVEVFQQIAGQLSVIVEKGRLYQELLELNQLKNRFLGIAAHDLRSPLTVVKGYSALLVNGIAGEITDRQKDVVGRIAASCDRMLALINDLLNVSAIEAGKLVLHIKDVELGGFLREAYETDQLLAQAKSITLKLDLQPNLPKVKMDPDRIGQVVDNLITNAIKFSFPDSEISLSARIVDGEQVEISVEDQGQGIPEDEIPKMFREFGRLSVRPTAGEASTGLGLAIVKRMVEAHGGRIWVRSQHGVGSVFTFTLPIKNSQLQEQEEHHDIYGNL